MQVTIGTVEIVFHLTTVSFSSITGIVDEGLACNYREPELFELCERSTKVTGKYHDVDATISCQNSFPKVQAV